MKRNVVHGGDVEKGKSREAPTEGNDKKNENENEKVQITDTEEAIVSIEKE
jgi:hypothetical protein